MKTFFYNSCYDFLAIKLLLFIPLNRKNRESHECNARLKLQFALLQADSGSKGHAPRAHFEMITPIAKQCCYDHVNTLVLIFLANEVRDGW